MNKSGWFWWCGLLFAASVVGFVMADYRHDVQHMIWSGFSGALWFRLAEREAAK